MKYKIRCNRCGTVFTMMSQHTGMVKCQCPQCGSAITCRVSDAIPTQQAQKNTMHQRLSRFSSHISDYQKQSRNGDLVVFFSFSFLFFLSVIVGLFVMAEITRGYVAGKTWLFHAYLNWIY